MKAFYRYLLLIMALQQTIYAQDARTVARAVRDAQTTTALPADLVLLGNYTGNDSQTVPVRIEIKGSDQVRYEFGSGRAAFATIINKGTGWSERDGKATRLEPHVSAQRPSIVPFLSLLTDIDKSEMQTPVLDASGALQHLRLRLPDPAPNTRTFRKPIDEEEDIYFDPNTRQIVRSERWTLADNNLEIRIRSILEFSDYRDVQGLKIPFRIVQTLVIPGVKPLQSLYVLYSATVNSGLPDSEFLPKGGGQ